MKDVFLIDADDTLLDFRRAEREELARTLKAFSLPAGEDVLRRFHDINDALWKKLERGEIARGRLVTERFEILFAEFGFSADAVDFSASYFANISENCSLIAGAEEFLRTLGKAGGIYIVTNGSAEVQKKRLARSGILNYARRAFISEEIGVYKPSPAYAEYVENHIEGYDRRRAVWVGDSLSSDCACARSAGIDFILFAPDGIPAGYAGTSASSYGEVLRKISEL